MCQKCPVSGFDKVATNSPQAGYCMGCVEIIDKTDSLNTYLKSKYCSGYNKPLPPEPKPEPEKPKEPEP